MKSKLPCRRCATRYCRRNARYGRRYCHTCRSRAYTARHPDIVAYLNLKKSAKRRDIEFSLTLDQFRRFAAKYGYLDHRGNEATSFTVDRVKSWHGYHAWNLQVLTRSQNTAKENAERRKAYVMARVHGWPVEMDVVF